MNIKIDTIAKAIYISFKDAKVDRTIEIAPEIFIDLDSKGKTIGLEMINPGKIEIKKIARKARIQNLLSPPIKSLIEKSQQVFA